MRSHQLMPCHYLRSPIGRGCKLQDIKLPAVSIAFRMEYKTELKVEISYCLPLLNSGFSNILGLFQCRVVKITLSLQRLCGQECRMLSSGLERLCSSPIFAMALKDEFRHSFCLCFHVCKSEIILLLYL